MRNSLHRFVMEEATGSKENESKNQRDHHVVVQAAARICPPQVAAEGAPEGGHSQHQSKFRLRTRQTGEWRNCGTVDWRLAISTLHLAVGITVQPLLAKC